MLSELIEPLKDERARDAVTINRDDVLTVFSASSYHKFRSLRAALDNFDRLVAKSDPRLAAAPAALRELLLYLVAIGMELRADSVQAENVKGLLGAARRLSFTSRPDPSAEAARQFIGKYPVVNWQNPIVSPGILVRLITSVVLPLQDIDGELAVHPLVVGPMQVPAWLTLWRFMEVNATNYAAARTALLDQLTSTAIVHPGEILHVVGTLIHLADFGGEVVPAVKAFFLTYIDKLRDHGTLVPETEVFDASNSTGWASYGFKSSDHSIFKKIRAHLQRAVATRHALVMADAAEKLLQRLQTPGSEQALYESDLKTVDTERAITLQHRGRRFC